MDEAQGDAAHDPERPRSDSISRNTAFALAVQLTSAVFTAAITLFLVRRLDPDGYGVFALALAVGALLTLPSDFGISASAARFIAEHRGDRAAVARVFVDALRLKLALAGAVSIALFAGAGLIAAAYDKPALTWPLRAVAIALFGQSLMLLFGGAFVAQARTVANFRIVLSESAVEATATIALVLLGGGAAGAAFGRAIGYTVGAAIGLVVTLRLVGGRRLARRSEQRARTREIARYAGALAIIDWVFTFLAQLDTIVIGALLTTTSVGLFQAPLRLVAFFQYPGLALASGVAPRLARHEHDEPNVAAFTRALRLLVVVQAALVVPLLVWADPIVDVLFGADYGESADVLRAMTPYVFLAGLAPLVSLAANYLGAARSRVPIAVAALLVNLAIDLTLIPVFGIVAAAVATDVAFALYVPAHLWICHRLVHLPLGRLAATLARTVLAATAAAFVLAAFGTSTLSAGDWLAGALLGPATYVSVLILTRELSVRELRAGAAALRGRVMPGSASR